MKKSTGIIFILLAIGVMLLSVLFSTGSHKSLGFIENIHRSSIVLREGENLDYSGPRRELYVIESIYVPLKYPLSIGVIVLLFGVGVVAISKKDK